MNKFLKNALALALFPATLVLSPVVAAEDNPLAPKMVKQYSDVLDNLIKAEKPSDIPDPIDKPKAAPASSDNTKAKPEPKPNPKQQ